jgi:hypothetical protein
MRLTNQKTKTTKKSIKTPREFQNPLKTIMYNGDLNPIGKMLPPGWGHEFTGKKI